MSHDPEWICVDLGATYNIQRVQISWEDAFAVSYQIQVSADGTNNWADIYATTTGDGGVDDLTGLSGTGRYIRMYGTQRGSGYGYSLWEFEVYGALQVTIRDAGGLSVVSSVSVTVNQTLTTITVTPASASVAINATQQFTATAVDQFNAAMSATYAWTVSGGGTINSSGLFTAGGTAGGPYTMTATSGGKSGTASVTVTSSESTRGVPPGCWVQLDRPLTRTFLVSDKAVLRRKKRYTYDSRVENIEYGTVQKGSVLLKAARLSWFGKEAQAFQYPQVGLGRQAPTENVIANE